MIDEVNVDGARIVGRIYFKNILSILMMEVLLLKKKMFLITF